MNKVLTFESAAKSAYNTLMIAINDSYKKIFFLDASGGSDKTFVISLSLASIHAQSQISLAVSSFVIAPTLLKGGRTAHSALKLPLNF